MLPDLVWQDRHSGGSSILCRNNLDKWPVRPWICPPGNEVGFRVTTLVRIVSLASSPSTKVLRMQRDWRVWHWTRRCFVLRFDLRTCQVVLKLAPLLPLRLVRGGYAHRVRRRGSAKTQRHHARGLKGLLSTRVPTSCAEASVSVMVNVSAFAAKERAPPIANPVYMQQSAIVRNGVPRSGDQYDHRKCLRRCRMQECGRSHWRSRSARLFQIATSRRSVYVRPNPCLYSMHLRRPPERARKERRGVYVHQRPPYRGRIS